MKNIVSVSRGNYYDFSFGDGFADRLRRGEISDDVLRKLHLDYCSSSDDYAISYDEFLKKLSLITPDSYDGCFGNLFRRKKKKEKREYYLLSNKTSDSETKPRRSRSLTLSALWNPALETTSKGTWQSSQRKKITNARTRVIKESASTSSSLSYQVKQDNIRESSICIGTSPQKALLNSSSSNSPNIVKETSKLQIRPSTSSVPSQQEHSVHSYDSSHSNAKKLLSQTSSSDSSDSSNDVFEKIKAIPKNSNTATKSIDKQKTNKSFYKKSITCARLQDIDKQKVILPYKEDKGKGLGKKTKNAAHDKINKEPIKTENNTEQLTCDDKVNSDKLRYSTITINNEFDKKPKEFKGKAVVHHFTSSATDEKKNKDLKNKSTKSKDDSKIQEGALTVKCIVKNERKALRRSYSFDSSTSSKKESSDSSAELSRVYNENQKTSTSLYEFAKNSTYSVLLSSSSSSVQVISESPIPEKRKNKKLFRFFSLLSRNRGKTPKIKYFEKESNSTELLTPTTQVVSFEQPIKKEKRKNISEFMKKLNKKSSKSRR